MSQVLLSATSMASLVLVLAVTTSCALAQKQPDEKSHPFTETQQWSVLGCQMEIPSRFEIIEHDENSGSAVDSAEFDDLGALRVSPYEDFRSEKNLQVLAEHKYGPVTAYLIRDTSPEIDHVVVGVIESHEKRQVVAAIGKVVHYLGPLAESCASSGAEK